jgi:hypothetical protein
MKLVFADAAYWIALVNPNDQWFEAAVAAYEELGPDAHLVTTEEVLTEVLNNFSRDGRRIREKAVEQVWTILNADDVTVHGQTHDSFLAGLQRYELRPRHSPTLSPRQRCTAPSSSGRSGG